MSKNSSSNHKGDHFVKYLSCIPTKSTEMNLGWRWGQKPYRKKKMEEVNILF